MLLLDLLLLFLFLAILIKSADVLQDAFVTIAHKLRLNLFLIGFAVLSFASSLPEISVAASASLDNVPGLSIGNLLGATIVLLTLVIGLNAIRHRELPFKGGYSFGFLTMSMAVIGTMVLTLADQHLSRLDGIVLISLYVFSTFLIVQRVSRKKERKSRKKIHPFKLLLSAVIGTAGLIIASQLLVDKAVVIASQLGVPNALIGLGMLGLGTNLPEITMLVRSNSAEKEKTCSRQLYRERVNERADDGFAGNP
ncbi:MAG: Inner membrane protein YrbG [candidate division WS6 bacterium OLB20]|uniref:Inner membrane protein YrbG n=1 Tax=candidate division WS6 bacterium OLB20 TaxID=1617426 RepID=A0A136LXM1_9BACT|nr:MAG: Inner membrane protein YrbG [candidate division WS6 bacterium OLB20]